MQRARHFVARHSAPSRTLRTRSVVTLVVAATGLATAVWLPTRFDRAEATESAPELVPVFADEFDGARGAGPDAAKWSTDGRGVRLDGDGNVAIFARAGQGEREADAGVQTRQTFTAPAGRVEARVRVADGESVRSVFRMLGADDSRLNIADNRGNRSRVLRAALGEVDGQFEAPESLATDFHTYSVTWQAGEVIWGIDGREFLRTQRDLDEPFAVALEVTAGQVDRDRTARRMLVDFVRVATAKEDQEQPPAEKPTTPPPSEEPTDPPSEEPSDPPSEEPTEPVAAWEPFQLYTAGTKVSFKGVTYEVLSTHTSLPGWEPTVIPELFKAV